MDQQPSLTPKPKKKSKLLKWAVGIFALIVFIGVVGSLAGNNNANKSTTTVTPPTVTAPNINGSVKGESTNEPAVLNINTSEVKETNQVQAPNPAVNVAVENKNANVQTAPKPDPTPTPVVNAVNTAPVDPTPTPIVNKVNTAPVPDFVVTEPAPITKYICDCSKTCPNMSSCEEAQYQLNTCGCSRRDGDKDGIACDEDCQ